MRSQIIYKGEAIREPSVHSSVRIPASLHAYARTHKISLSKTLTVVLAAAKVEEEAGTGSTAANLTPIPADPHTNLRENHEDTSTRGGCGE